MERKSLTKIASFLFFNIFSYDISVLKFLSKLEVFTKAFWSFITLNTIYSSSNVCVYTENNIDKPRPSSIGREDLKIVMGKLGISGDVDGENTGEFDDVEDVLSLMFNDVESDQEECVISMEEVKEAFDVFDYNKDGFIDEMELQRVICALGIQLKGYDSLGECRRMISEFDENGDGLIDFQEFFTLTSNCFCI